VRLVLQLVDLALRRSAADQQQRADARPRVARELDALALNLDGELVGRCDDHQLRRREADIDPAEQRQQVSQRLARACLGMQVRILAGEQHGSRRDLDGRGFGDRLRRERGDQRSGYLQIGE
jgi:hypothetical protein